MVDELVEWLVDSMGEIPVDVMVHLMVVKKVLSMALPMVA